MSTTGKRLRPQLGIGATSDPLEREADRVADEALATDAARPPTTTAAPNPRVSAVTRSDPVPGRRLIAHELTHVMQQSFGDGGSDAGTIQREPVCPDDSCDADRQGTLADRVAEALALVRQAIRALSEPAAIAGPLKRLFRIDVEKAGARGAGGDAMNLSLKSTARGPCACGVLQP